MSGQMTYLKTTLMVLAMMSGAAALPVQAATAKCSVASPHLQLPNINLSTTNWSTTVFYTSEVNINYKCDVTAISNNPDRYKVTLAVDKDFKTVVDALKAAHLGLNLKITDRTTGSSGTLYWNQVKMVGGGHDIKVSFATLPVSFTQSTSVTGMATLTGEFFATDTSAPNVPVNIHVAGAPQAFDIRPVNDGTYDFSGYISTSAFNIRLFPSGSGKICISTSGPYACDVNQPNAAVDFGHLYPTSVDSLTRTLPFWVKATQSIGTTSPVGFDVPLNIEFVSEGETLTASGQAIKLRNPDKEENGLVLSISGPDGKVTFNQPAPMNISLHFAQSTGDTASQEYLAKVEPASNNAEIKTGRFSAGLTVKVTYN